MNYPPRFTKHVRILAPLCVVAFTLFPLAQAGAGRVIGQASHAGRAATGVQAASLALQAMQRLDDDFYDSRLNLYCVIGLPYAPTASLWPTSQVLSAAIHVARITHAPADLDRVRRIIRSLHAYEGPLGVFHTRTVPTRTYYDDNNWIALDLLDAYALLHDPSYLQLAEHIFQFETTGWDSKRGGGIRWAVGDLDRNTVSTVPPIIIGLRLAMLTHSSSYWAWAIRLYQWENAHLRAPNGLYWDHLKPNGAIDRRFFSYNQGLMIGADLALAAYTGRQSYVSEAARIASLTARLHPQPWHPRGMRAAFDAIYYQELADLDRHAPKAAVLDVARDYLQWAGPAARAPRAAHTEGALFEQAAYVIDAAVLADR